MNLEQLDALSQKVAKALYIIENLKAEKVNLSTQVATLKAEVQDAQQRAESSQQRVESSQQEAAQSQSALEAELEEHKLAKAELEIQYQELQEHNNQLSSQNGELQEAFNSVEAELRGFQLEDGKRDQLIEEAQARLQGMLSSLEGLDSAMTNPALNTPTLDNPALEESTELSRESIETESIETQSNESQEQDLAESGQISINKQDYGEDEGQSSTDTDLKEETSSSPDDTSELVSELTSELVAENSETIEASEEPSQDLFGNLSNQPFIVEEAGPEGVFIETPLTQETLYTEDAKFADSEKSNSSFQAENFQAYSVESPVIPQDESFETEEVLEVESHNESVEVLETEWTDDWDEDVSAASQTPQSGTDYVEEDGVVWSGENEPSEEEN